MSSTIPSDNYALIGAAVIATHSVFIKLFLSLTLRVYQYLNKSNQKKLDCIANNKYVMEFQKAQVNESEYAPLIVAILFYLSTVITSDVVSRNNYNVMAGGTIFTAAGQILYVWARTLFGYPTIPVVLVAVVRYVGLILLLSQVWSSVTQSDYVPADNA